MTDHNDALERRLQEAYRVEPPESLKESLLAIPDNVPRAAEEPASRARRNRLLPAWLGAFEWRLAVPAFAVIAAFTMIWGAGLRLVQDGPGPAADTVALTEQEQARKQAIRDFVTVMNYLHRSTARAHTAVQSELGAGLMTAFERGEQSFKDSSNRVTNGG